MGGHKKAFVPAPTTTLLANGAKARGQKVQSVGFLGHAGKNDTGGTNQGKSRKGESNLDPRERTNQHKKKGNWKVLPQFTGARGAFRVTIPKKSPGKTKKIQGNEPLWAFG